MAETTGNLSSDQTPAVTGVSAKDRAQHQQPKQNEELLLLHRKLNENEARLLHTSDELSQYVSELQKANEKINDSRRAALNVLEDAILSREALRESEERFRCLVESYAQAVWETNAEGVVVVDSPSWRAYTGQTFEEWIGYGWLNAIHPDDREYAERQWHEAISARRNVNTEFRIKHASEGYRWTNARATPIFGTDGSILKWTGMNIDIHDRKQTEAALRESEERQAFLLRLSDALRSVESAAEIKAVASRVLGEQLQANHVYFAAIEANYEYAVIPDDYYSRGNSPHIAGRYRINDYSQWVFRELCANRPLIVSNTDTIAEDSASERAQYATLDVRAFIAYPFITAGKLTAILAITHSTPRGWKDAEVALVKETAERTWIAVERAQAEWQLRVREAELARVQQISGVGGLDIDVQDHLRGRRSPEYLRLHGLPADMTEESYESWIQRIHPEDRDNAIQVLQDALAGSDANYENEYRIIRLSDGQERWIYARADIERDANGRPIRLVGAHLDITERKRHEANTAFLSSLQDDFSQFTSADEIMQAVGAKLGKFLKVQYCHFMSINEARKAVVYLDHWQAEGVPQMPNQVSLSAQVSEDFYPLVRAGKTVVSNDTQPNPIAQAGTNDSINVRAFITVPFHQGGEWKYLFSVQDINPRKWRQDEIELVRELANRIFLRLERARAEAALRASEERFRLATEAAQIYAWQIEVATGKITYSDNAPALLGYENLPEYLTGDLDSIHPDDRKRVSETIGQAIHDGARFNVEYRFLTAAQKTIWLSLTGVLLHDAEGKAHTIAGIGQDITARKQAEAELATAVYRYRVAEEAAKSFNYDWNLDSGLIVRSPSVEQVLGYPPDKIGTNWQAWADLVHPDHRRVPSETEAIEYLRSFQEESFEDQFLLRHQDGHYVWVMERGLLIRDAQGVVRRVIGQILDITERRRLEAERERLLIEEQRARASAEAATQAKDEFLAIVSHELRSPLNAILGWARILRSHRGDDPEVEKIVDIIERNGRTQTQLIEDLLDTARIISGKLKLDIATVELTKVITDALDTIRPAAEAKGITIEIVGWSTPPAGEGELIQTVGSMLETKPSPIYVTGDANRLQQIAWNLLSNSVKFTPEKGRVRVAIKRGDTNVTIEISDTGKGISADLMPYVFERFRQGDSSASRRFGGLGLGLALVKHLIELHGGSVRVQSAGEGKGASFVVTMPTKAPDKKPDLEETVEDQSYPDAFEPSNLSLPTDNLKGLRVLVVDDEEFTRDLLSYTLKRFHIKVKTVDSASAALTALENAASDTPFDLLLSDIGMPIEDGYDLLERVRTHPNACIHNLPAVAMTAYTRKEDKLKALAVGYQLHLSKPFEVEELVSVLASVTKRGTPLSA